MKAAGEPKWILLRNWDGTWTYGGYRLHKTKIGDLIYRSKTSDKHVYNPEYRFYAWKEEDSPICRTRAEAILKFQLERPGEKLYERKDMRDRISYDSEEEFAESVTET